MGNKKLKSRSLISNFKRRYFSPAPAIALLLLILIGLLSSSSIFHKNVANPNILLLTVCSLRQDHLGYSGYSRNTSPAIDKLAGTSTYFRNCYTHIPWTKPSVSALMTGQYPGTIKNDVEGISLVSLLNSAGYITCGIIGSNMVRDSIKINLEFTSFFDNYNLKTNKDPHTVRADTVVNKAIEWLTEQRFKRSPLFLWLFFKDPHWPYIPPSSYRHKFIDDPLYLKQTQNLTINKDFNDSIGGIGEARLRDDTGKLITNRAYYIAQYDAEIRFLDSQIDIILEYLKRNSNFDDWLIVLLADHGESLGEGGYYFDHGYFLSEALIRIPLLIKLPQQKKQAIRNGIASICDIFPTIAELAGFPKQDLLKMNLYGKNLFFRKVWRPGQYQRQIMIENSEAHESGNIKLLGGINLPYKFVHIVSKKTDKLYNISKEELLITNYNKQQLIVIEKIKKYILDFCNSLDKTFQTNREELRSLGYLQ
ncbi:MAG: sulfatase [Candidatus Omnitrophota bacterium]